MTECHYPTAVCKGVNMIKAMLIIICLTELRQLYINAAPTVPRTSGKTRLPINTFLINVSRPPFSLFYPKRTSSSNIDDEGKGRGAMDRRLFHDVTTEASVYVEGLGRETTSDTKRMSRESSKEIDDEVEAANIELINSSDDVSRLAADYHSYEYEQSRDMDMTSSSGHKDKLTEEGAKTKINKLTGKDSLNKENPSGSKLKAKKKKSDSSNNNGNKKMKKTTKKDKTASNGKQKLKKSTTKKRPKKNSSKNYKTTPSPDYERIISKIPIISIPSYPSISASNSNPVSSTIGVTPYAYEATPLFTSLSGYAASRYSLPSIDTGNGYSVPSIDIYSDPSARQYLQQLYHLERLQQQQQQQRKQKQQQQPPQMQYFQENNGALNYQQPNRHESPEHNLQPVSSHNSENPYHQPFNDLPQHDQLNRYLYGYNEGRFGEIPRRNPVEYNDQIYPGLPVEYGGQIIPGQPMEYNGQLIGMQGPAPESYDPRFQISSRSYDAGHQGALGSYDSGHSSVDSINPPTSYQADHQSISAEVIREISRVLLNQLHRLGIISQQQQPPQQSEEAELQKQIRPDVEQHPLQQLQQPLQHLQQFPLQQQYQPLSYKHKMLDNALNSQAVIYSPGNFPLVISPTSAYLKSHNSLNYGAKTSKNSEQGANKGTNASSSNFLSLDFPGEVVREGSVTTAQMTTDLVGSFRNDEKPKTIELKLGEFPIKSKYDKQFLHDDNVALQILANKFENQNLVPSSAAIGEMGIKTEPETAEYVESDEEEEEEEEEGEEHEEEYEEEEENENKEEGEVTPLNNDVNDIDKTTNRLKLQNPETDAVTMAPLANDKATKNMVGALSKMIGGLITRQDWITTTVPNI